MNRNLHHTKKNNHAEAEFIAQLLLYGVSAYAALILVIAVGVALHLM